MPTNLSKIELDPFRSGDPIYFVRMVNQVQDLVVGYIFGRIGRIAAARQLAVRAFSDLYSHLESIHDEEALMLTLYQCTKTCCERTESNQSIRLDGTSDNPFGDQIAEMLKDMEAYERLMAVLAYLFGSTQADISGFTGMPSSMVQRRLDSARQKLPSSFLKLSLSEMQQLRPSKNTSFSDEIRKEMTRLYSEKSI